MKFPQDFPQTAFFPRYRAGHRFFHPSVDFDFGGVAVVDDFEFLTLRVLHLGAYPDVGDV